MPQRPIDQLAQQARAWTVALNVVYGTIGFGLMGFAVDYFAGTGPWGLLVGAVVGLVVGTYRFVREAMAMSRPRPAGRERAPSDGKKTP